MKFSSSKQWILAGVTSFGDGCGRVGNTGVYTRVAFFSSWIKKTVSEGDLLTDSVLTAGDKLLMYKEIYDIPNESIANSCALDRLCLLFFIVITIR